MSYIKLQVLNKNGEILKEVCGEDEANFVYLEEYQEGDRIVLDVEEANSFYYVQLDDAKGKSLVYLTGKVEYFIPFGEKRVNISPKVFSGSRHVLSVKKAFKDYHKEGIFSEVSKDVIRPSAEECARNPRAKSTKMRWAIKAE